MKNKEKLLNLPNCLCLFRILLIPVFLFVYFKQGTKYHYILAAFILVLSGISDFLDGYIARKYDMVTDFGKLLDPIADKLTQITIAITMLSSYPLAWILLIIIILKDAMLGIVGLYLYEYGLKMKGASWWGKVATAYFYVVVIILIGFHMPNTVASMVMIITSSALMLLSFVLYAKELRQMLKEKDRIINEQKRH